MNSTGFVSAAELTINSERGIEWVCNITIFSSPATKKLPTFEYFINSVGANRLSPSNLIVWLVDVELLPWVNLATTLTCGDEFRSFGPGLVGTIVEKSVLKSKTSVVEGESCHLLAESIGNEIEKDPLGCCGSLALDGSDRVR